MRQLSNARKIAAYPSYPLFPQVRVFHCGYAYLHHVLPDLAWFSGCSDFKCLAIFACYKGSGRTLEQVPAADRQLPAGQWTAAPRSVRANAKNPPLTWRINPSQLQQLDDGKSLYSPTSAYVNGFMVTLNVERQAKDGGGCTLGIYLNVDSAAMRSVPWAASAVALVRLNAVKVVGPKQNEKLVQGKRSWNALVGTRGRGWPNFLGRSGASIAEVVAPYLREGHLHVEAELPAVDMSPDL